MPILLFRFFAFFLLTTAVVSAQTVADQKLVPAVLDVVTFSIHVDGENHQMVVTMGAPLLRIDEPDDRYSIIYDPHSEDYIGLEHSNYTYWDFSWPEVKDAVAASKRGEAQLRDLISEGASDYDKPAPDADTNGTGTPAADSTTSDNFGYIWKQTTDKKNIAGLDCIRWTGDSLTGESVSAWCYSGPLPKIQAAIEQIRAVNEPMALVPVRTLIPPYVFPVYDALVRGGVTPVQIIWGGDRDKNHFGLVSAKTRAYKAELFAIPKLYIKTTLVTMDGITNPVREKN